MSQFWKHNSRMLNKKLSDQKHYVQIFFLSQYHSMLYLSQKFHYLLWRFTIIWINRHVVISLRLSYLRTFLKFESRWHWFFILRRWIVIALYYKIRTIGFSLFLSDTFSFLNCSKFFCRRVNLIVSLKFIFRFIKLHYDTLRHWFFSIFLLNLWLVDSHIIWLWRYLMIKMNRL